jgi:hypothetical protein
MKNKTMILALSSVLFTILFMHLVPAPGPNFHVTSVVKAINESDNTLIKQLIEDNFDACLVGFEYPDVGIFEYYTNFKEYAGLHNYNVPDEMLRIAKNDRERAFAYCYKLHLAADSVSHNFFVPVAIKRTKIPNYLLHPVQELKIEGRYLDPRSNHMMEQHAEFDSLVEKATGRNWAAEAEKLNTIIGGGQFYSKAYNPDTGTSWGKVQNYIYMGLAYVVPVNDEIDLAKLCLEEEKAVLRGETNDFDPSGEKALNDADAETQLWLYVGSFAIFIVIFVLSWYFRIIGWRKKKK